MNMLNNTWANYKNISSLTNALTNTDSSLVSLQATLGSQHSTVHHKTRHKTLLPGRMTGDSGVYADIRGKGEGSTLDVISSDLAGSAITRLNVEGKKTFAADTEEKTITSSQHSVGGGGGIGAQIRSGPAYGLQLHANTGKSATNGNSTTYRLSHIGSLTGHTDIGDGKTLVNGAQILGKSIEGNTRDLVAISPQGSVDYDSKTLARSGNVVIGYGAAGGAEGENTRIRAHEKTINKESGRRVGAEAVSGGNERSKTIAANTQQAAIGGQSGFFAGDDGFRIKNSGTATLEGATLVSTDKAEAEGKNHFSTDRLIRKDLENHSEYQGKSVASGLGAALAGNKNSGQQQIRWLANISDQNGLGKTIGFDRTGKNEHGTSYASINTANITINDAAGQQALGGESVAGTIHNASRGMTLASAKEQSGAADAHFDAAKIENRVRTSAQEMKTFGNTIQGARSELRERAEKNRRESLYQRDPEKRTAQLQRADQQEKLAMATNMLGGALTPADSVAGGIANTLAPAIAYKTGQDAKERGTEGTAGHIAAHALLAGATTALNGGSTGDILSSAAITGAAEYSAPKLARLLYGKDINQLTAAEKNTLGQTISTLATGAGATAGGNTATACNAGKTAQNAVENNYMVNLHNHDKKPKIIQEHTDKLLAAGAMPFEKLDEKYKNCQNDKDCQNAVKEEWRKESKKTAILEKELTEKGELELKHLNGYSSTKEQKDESYSSQMARSANRSKTALGQREAMSWNTIGKPQEADEALSIAISRNDDRLGLSEREREKWDAITASSPGDLMFNYNGLATRHLLSPETINQKTSTTNISRDMEGVKELSKTNVEIRKIQESDARRSFNPNTGFHQRIGNKETSYIVKLQATKRTDKVTYDLKLSERHFPNHLSISKKENSIFLGTRIEANKDLAEIRAGLASRNDNLFTTSSGRVWERHGNTIHPYSGPDVINITAKEYQVLKKYKKEGIKEVRYFMSKMIENNAINSEQVDRVNKILKRLGE